MEHWLYVAYCIRYYYAVIHYWVDPSLLNFDDFCQLVLHESSSLHKLPVEVIQRLQSLTE